jgi:serine/threonine-protein kinase
MSALLCPDDGIETLDLSQPVPNDDAIQVGSTFHGRYRIEQELGNGGMGCVFVALQLSMKRKIAIKVLKRDPHQLDARDFKRFYQEARAASMLDHPNIVRVFEFGIDSASRRPFIAMEYIEGQTLRQKLDAEGPFSERRAAAILTQVARALVEAHSKSVLHRDLKPQNVMLSALKDGDEHVRVLDFGIAQIQDPERGERLTDTGATLGTPWYMSPEQVKAHPLDHRSDLYSLGCVLHEMLTGEPPYGGAPGLVMYMHANSNPPQLPAVLSDAAAPSDRLVVLHRALLAKARVERPDSAAVVAKTLSELAQGLLTSTPPPPVPRPVSAPAPADPTPKRLDPVGHVTHSEPPPLEHRLDSGSTRVLDGRGRWVLAGFACLLMAAVGLGAVVAKQEHAPARAEAPAAPAPEPPRPKSSTVSARPLEDVVVAPPPPRAPAPKPAKPRRAPAKTEVPAEHPPAPHVDPLADPH